MSIFNPKKWSQAHFQHAKLGDYRRTERLVNISANMAKSSGKSIASSCLGNEADLEGAYRLIRNKKVSPEMIRVAGFQHTASLVKDVPEILALEDTTSLSYKHQVANELGKLGKKTDKARGWWVHSTLLLDSKTTQTLGLIHQDWWRRPDDIDDADEKESGKWADASYFCRQRLGDTMTRVISVCDREADILSYLENKQQHKERFVVRAKHRRKLTGTDKNLFDYLDEQPQLGEYSIKISQKGMKNSQGKPVNRASRTARLTVKVAQVTLDATTAVNPLNVVYAAESNSEGKSEALRWVLLTSEPIASLKEALHVIDIYAARWRIEDFHKAWKTGAGAERQRMTEPAHLERAVSILAFIGVRLLQLREVMSLPLYLRKKGLIDEALEMENQCCDTVFEEDEWKILLQHYKVRGHDGKTAPSMKWAYQSLAKLGGFTDSKRTGMASWSTIWEGWDILQAQVSGYRVAKEMLASGKTL